MRSALLPRLRRTLNEQNLSLERATFGTWTVVVQRLAAAFRDELHRDSTDAVARLRRRCCVKRCQGMPRIVTTA
jgi:type I restriction enzyme M protein